MKFLEEDGNTEEQKLDELVEQIANSIQVKSILETDTINQLSEEERKIAEEDGILVNDEQTEYISLRISEFRDEKHLNRFVNACKRLIRSSIEYKRWLCFLRDNLNLTESPFSLENLEETNSIEIHHHPITLDEIIRIVVYNKLQRGQSFSTFDIALEVLDLHYKMRVGVVPLTKTEHSKYHQGYLLIPIEFVTGNWQYILEYYDIPDDIYRSILQRSEIRLKDVIEFYKEDKRNLRYIGIFWDYINKLI